MRRRPIPGTPTQRFWRNVHKPDNPDACWTWTGYGTQGYGQHFTNGTKTYAHRYAYELTHGPIPDGLVLDHLCRNRLCVNPAHMQVVTLAENARRARSKRWRRSHPKADTVGPPPDPTLFDPSSPDA
jgi:hypothetical protein